MSRPNSLFKYYKVNEYTLGALRTRSLWLAKPSTFNDPYDCALTLSEGKYRESVLHAITAAINAPDTPQERRDALAKEWPGDREAFEKARQSILNLFKDAGICCFSTNDNHILMWSHYAHNHTGICVEYDFSPGSGTTILPRQVRYKRDIPQLSLADFAPSASSSTFDTLWLTKAPEWEYENEWRIIMNEGNKNYEAPPIISVAFGAKTSDTDKFKVIESLGNKSRVLLKDSQLSTEKFEIIVQHLP